jgi:hypothetical protein
MRAIFFYFFTLPSFCISCSDKSETPPTIPDTPPYHGTIFLSPDIITANDPTSFESISPAGHGSRVMFDRRVNNWITVDAYLFNATFDDGLSVEVQVNPEFGSAELAQAPAEKYAIVIGRLPSTLRKDVQTVWIHKGTELFGGGNNNLLIHIGQADVYESEGILEETFVHEASHTSLDHPHATAAGWVAAQDKDPTFISTYARDNPTREDIAETVLLYLAVRHGQDRIPSEIESTVLKAIPNRIQYLDGLTWDLYPWK